MVIVMADRGARRGSYNNREEASRILWTLFLKINPNICLYYETYACDVGIKLVYVKYAHMYWHIVA